MLPQWVGVSKNHFIDISGLMSGHEKTPVGMQKVVRNRNTDQMRIVSRQVYLHTGENLPVLRGNKVNVKHYKQDLLNGFTALYRFFVAHKKEWLHPQGVLQRFEGLSVRYIFRPTNIYHKIFGRLP